MDLFFSFFKEIFGRFLLFRKKKMKIQYTYVYRHLLDSRTRIANLTLRPAGEQIQQDHANLPVLQVLKPYFANKQENRSRKR